MLKKLVSIRKAQRSFRLQMIKDKQSKKNQQTKQKQSEKKHTFNLFSMRMKIRKYTAKSD